MEDYDYNILKEAGRVSYEALQYSKTIVKEEVKLIDAADKIERFIKEKGFELAFPVNLSINQNAAHYTPSFDDSAVFTKEDVIKVDLGARKDTYLSDCAVTIDLSQKHSKLVDAAEEALNVAISMVKAGIKVNKIGEAIEKVAKSKGVNPIKNLGGHGIDKTNLHAKVFIPNYDNGDETELDEGEIVAIEPFMTSGEGYVQDGEYVQIFQKIMDSNPRSKDARDVAAFITEKYKTYPFATRWLQSGLGDFGEFRIRRALNELLGIGAIEEFPVLVEKTNGMVAQAEKELIVEKDSCTVVTK